MFLKNAKKTLSRQKGFTLVELIVVIAVLGVLSAIVGVNMLNYIQAGRMKVCMAECMECVASAQTLLVESNTYGMDIPSSEDIAESAGVDGSVVYYRISDNTVTHLCYSKGSDAYIYCRYYEELGTNNLGGHLYSLVREDSGVITDPNDPNYDADAVKQAMEEASLAINNEDLINGVNDLYTYVNSSDIKTEAIGAIQVDDPDSDIPYSEEDATQDDETVEPTTTTATTTTVASSTADSSDGTLYKALLYYIFNGVSYYGNTEDLSGAAIVCFPKSGHALAMDDIGSGSYFAYTADGYYYMFDYGISGANSNIVIQDMHASSISSSFTLSGGYNNAGLKLFCSDSPYSNFEKFIGAWEEEGLKSFVDEMVDDILAAFESQGSLLTTFADTRSSAQNYTSSTKPSSESDGTIIYLTDKSTYQVYLSFSDNDSWPAGWYDLPDDDTIVKTYTLVDNSNYNGTYTLP